jgi:high-affinity nickel permease
MRGGSYDERRLERQLAARGLMGRFVGRFSGAVT